MNGVQLPNFTMVYLEMRLSDWFGARTTGGGANSARTWSAGTAWRRNEAKSWQAGTTSRSATCSNAAKAIRRARMNRIDDMAANAGLD